MREYALHLQKYIDVYRKKMILKSPEKQPLNSDLSDDKKEVVPNLCYREEEEN